MLLEFTLAVARSLNKDLAQFPVDFNAAWQWFGYDSRDEAKTSLLSIGFIIGIDLTIEREIATFDNPCPQQQIKLTTECLKVWALMTGSEQSLLIRKCLVECQQMTQPTLDRPKPEPMSLMQIADLAMFVSQQASAIAGLSPELSAQLAIQAGILVCPEIAKAIEPTQQAIATAHVKSKLLTVSQLGNCIGLSKRATNYLLSRKGLQSLNESHDGKCQYLPTTLGEQHSKFTGCAIYGTQELLWKESVLSLLGDSDRN